MVRLLLRLLGHRLRRGRLLGCNDELFVELSFKNRHHVLLGRADRHVLVVVL